MRRLAPDRADVHEQPGNDEAVQKANSASGVYGHKKGELPFLLFMEFAMRTLMMTIMILLALLATGCTATHRISLDDSQTVFDDFGEMNTRLPGKTVMITTAGGNSVKARLVQIGRDSTVWVTKSTEDTVVVATNALHRIVLTDRRKGAFDGLVWGLVGGGTAGALIGYFGSKDPGKDCVFYCPTRADQAILGGVLLGGTAGILGVLIGSAGGAHEIYLFEQ
jgi:uncharacterized protein YcfL